VRNEKLDMRCLDKIGLFLLVAIIVDFVLEALDYIHRLYQSEESIGILTQLVSSKLFLSLVVVQLLLGMLLSLLILVLVRSVRFNEDLRKLLYFTTSLLILVGIFSMRWNVVIGGQLYSKSLRGLMATRWRSRASRACSRRWRACAAVHNPRRCCSGCCRPVDGENVPAAH
jgi:hypothetical protein